LKKPPLTPQKLPSTRRCEAASCNDELFSDSKTVAGPARNPSTAGTQPPRALRVRACQVQRTCKLRGHNQKTEIGLLCATAGLPGSAPCHLFERALVSREARSVKCVRNSAPGGKGLRGGGRLVTTKPPWFTFKRRPGGHMAWGRGLTYVQQSASRKGSEDLWNRCVGGNFKAVLYKIFRGGRATSH